MTEYIRDKRSLKPSSETASKIMSAIKGKNTQPELTLRKALWKEGVRGYRLHWKKVPGKKVAIFVHGCYWHRCPHCRLPLPKSNTSFWQEKFTRNVARDKKKIEHLEENGWSVLVFWECHIPSNLDEILLSVKKKTNKALLIK